MIITTTPSVEGHPTKNYVGVVFGEVINGVNFIKDFTAGITNIFGGRAGEYEEELINAREDAIAEMSRRAMGKGANAVVGVKVDYETIGQNNSMLMVIASGTAVVIEE